MSAGSDARTVGPGERVTLPGTDLELSRLGFGTAALMSRVNRRDSVRLLETALDSGITHLDTARSYGFGEAELAVGDVLAGRRERITVTTKLGILPPPRSSVLAFLKAGARGLIAVAPGIRAQVRRGAGRLVKAGAFDADTMVESLHTSLRQMRTEYIDLLLLHEPSIDVLARSEPLELLQRMRREGKVRFFGIASSPEVATYAVETQAAYAAVLQFPNSIFAPSPRGLLQRAGRGIITHSALGGRILQLRAALSEKPELAQRWSSLLMLDVLAPGALEKLALQYSLMQVPDGAVLFASTKVAHVRENAAALSTAVSPVQMEQLEALVREWGCGVVNPRPVSRHSDTR